MPVAVGLLYRRFQFAAGSESRHTPGGNLQGLAVGGIPHTPRLPVQYPEAAETGDGDAVAACETGANPLDERIQRAGRLGPRQSCVRRNFVDQIFFVHEAPNAREQYQDRKPVSIRIRVYCCTTGSVHPG